MVVCLRDNNKRHLRQNSSGVILSMSNHKSKDAPLQVNQDIPVRLLRPKPSITITPDMIHGFGDFKWPAKQKLKVGKKDA